MQHYSMPLDGDMAGGIVPAEDVKLILNDPFGISVITDNAVYPNPNRYFAHWTFFTYFIECLFYSKVLLSLLRVYIWLVQLLNYLFKY